MSEELSEKQKMYCKICGSTDIQFISIWSDTTNEYGCLKCGRTIITFSENEDKKIEV